MSSRIAFSPNPEAPARRDLRTAGLAMVPMLMAVAGGAIDERTRSGFSNWRSVCRASGPSFTSLVSFTVDLLPIAMSGALLGLCALQFAAAVFWYRAGGARAALAPHVGCGVGMTVGLPLCALTSSVWLMLAAEAAIAGGLAVLLCRWPFAHARGAASVTLPRSVHSNAY
jgi:hypothetical protein